MRQRLLPLALVAALATVTAPALVASPAGATTTAHSTGRNTSRTMGHSTAHAAPKATSTNLVETRVLPGSEASLYGMKDTRLPRVWYHLYLQAGERFVPVAQSGIVSAAAEILNRGPSDMAYPAYRQFLFRQGSDVRWEAGNRYLVAHVKCLPSQLQVVTKMLRHSVSSPRLDNGTVSHVMGMVINQRKTMDDNMSDVTINYAKQKLWDFRPEARMPAGWVETLNQIHGSDLKAYFKQRLAHPAGFVATVAPISPASVAAGIGPALKTWLQPLPGGRAPYPGTLPPRRVIFIDKPGATDNQIFAISPMPVDLTSGEAAAAEVFFAGMGLDLGARLGHTLRVQRGLTYHAQSTLRRVEWPQWFAYSFGGMTQTPKIVAGIFELFDAAKGGLTPEEVATAKSKLLQSNAGDMESPAQQLDAVASAVAQGLPASYPFSRPKLISTVTAAEVQVPARLAAGLEHATIVVMGDVGKLKIPVTAALPAGTAVEVRRLDELGPEALRAGASSRL